MKFFLSNLILFFFTNFALAAWELPNTPPSGIGDPGSFYLNKSGVTFHLNNNDYLGMTDKLMTGSTWLAMYLMSEKKGGAELSIHRRFIVPIIKTKHGEPEFQTPLGAYADQLEYKLAFSRLFNRFKIDVSVSAELYRDFNGDKMQKYWHDLVGATDYTNRYTNRVNNDYLAGSAGMGFILSNNFLFMVYTKDSPIMRDYTARLSWRYENGAYQVGLQAEATYQESSKLYDDDTLEEFRGGGGLAMKWGWYQFSVNYISKYLTYDKHGQLYLDPLIVSFEF